PQPRRVACALPPHLAPVPLRADLENLPQRFSEDFWVRLLPEIRGANRASAKALAGDFLMPIILRGSERSMPFDVGRTETLHGAGVCRPRRCSRVSTILRSCRVDHRKAARHPLRIEAPASVSGEHS